jgi:hypothetical protein
MGHGCTNYDWFGEKGLGGIGWVWGLDRFLGGNQDRRVCPLLHSDPIAVRVNEEPAYSGL